MFYKQYGNTEMKVSAIGFGSMRYNDEDVRAGRLEKCAEIPLYAFEQGINYFDTAPFYCNDKSEEITGIALSQLKRESYFVSSKTNFNAIGEQINRDTFRRRLETSLTRLKTDYLDFYHLWCILDEKGYKEQSEALYGFFEEARSEGLIRNIVFSAHMQGDEIKAVVDTGKYKGMLIGYNALNYLFRQSGIEAAYQKGMGVVVMNPLAGGLIPTAADRLSYIKEGELTVVQSALRFVASHREITITLAGCTTKEHIDDAVKAVENLKELPAAEIVRKYESIGKQTKDASIFNSLCTGCGYCKGCPMNIAIPKLMDSYNQMLLTGKKQYMLDRMDEHWDIPITDAAKCIGCKKCEDQCTQHLPIITRMREMADMA